jgi:hypothetical protein
MYVYISPEVQNAASEQHLEIIENIRQQIENGDPLLFGLLFSPRFPHWVKRIRRRWRLIATLKVVEGERVLCCTHLLARGSHEYRSFLDNPGQWGCHNIRLEEADLQQWLQERQQVQPIEYLPVPDHLPPWLEKPTLLQRDNRTIFETRVWVEKWQNRELGIIAFSP